MTIFKFKPKSLVWFSALGRMRVSGDTLEWAMRMNQGFSECVPGQLCAGLDFPSKQREVPWFSMYGEGFLILFFH